MNAPKCQPEDYIDFLVAARAQPARADPPAHGALTRLLHRPEPEPATLWGEAAARVRREGGVLVLDDSTLDKPYARKMGVLTRHGSGEHRRVVQGLNLLTLRWTDDEALIPCDDRPYEEAADGLSKNAHFRAMLATARGRGFAPECVVFGSWYASLANLKAARGHGWRWATRPKANRLVNPDGTGNRPLADCALDEAGTRVHPQGYGVVLVFLIALPEGGREYWATSDRGMGELTRRKYAEFAWGIAAYHRGLRQHCGVERAEVRAARAQRNHITCALCAFLRLEHHRVVTGNRLVGGQDGYHPRGHPAVPDPSPLHPRLHNAGNCVSPNGFHGGVVSRSFRLLSRRFSRIAANTPGLFGEFCYTSLRCGVSVSPGSGGSAGKRRHTGDAGNDVFRMGMLKIRGPLAQLAEQLTLNQRVHSSSLWRLTPGAFSQL